MNNSNWKAVLKSGHLRAQPEQTYTGRSSGGISNLPKGGSQELKGISKNIVNKEIPRLEKAFEEKYNLENVRFYPRYEHCFPLKDKYACYVEVYYTGGKTTVQIVFDLDGVELS
jgi:hypothetical protein